MYKITKKVVVQYIEEGIIFSTLWTIALTPYSVIVEALTLGQFGWWLLMEYTLVLPIGPIINYVGNKIIKRFKK